MFFDYCIMIDEVSVQLWHLRKLVMNLVRHRHLVVNCEKRICMCLGAMGNVNTLCNIITPVSINPSAG